MLALALVLSILAMIGMVAGICYGVYLAYRKPPTQEVIQTGTYKISLVGFNKLTGKAEYQFTKLEEDTDGCVNSK